MKILLVEDSKRLQLAICTGLRKEGFAVEVSGDGEEALHLAETFEYDLIILDLMLPGIDGLSILQHLRGKNRKTHVLILTAKHTVEDRVKGLNLGADDYLAKPFAFDELLARIQALLRRKYGAKNPMVRFQDLEVDTTAKRVRRGDDDVPLSPREYKLLEVLILRAGQVVSRTELEEHIYDERVSPMSNVVDSAICNLRKKLNRDGRPNLIHTLRGMGYTLRPGGE